MEQAMGRDSYLGYLSKAVRRHMLLVLVVVLLGLAVAGAYVHTKAPTYTATATLLPRPLLGNPLGPDISASSGTQLTVAMQTEAGLVDTPGVAERATKSLGATVPRPQDVVTATVPPNTQIIAITYRSGTARQAQQGAQAFAEAFLSYREGVSLAAQRQTLASLVKQRDLTQAALRTASLAVPLHADPQSFAAQRVLLYSNQLAALQNRISSTQALSVSPGRVAKSASLPTSADGLHPWVIVVAGALLALVLGLLLATRIERRRGVVDAVSESDVSGVPLLARVPRIPPDASRLISDHEPADALPEAYRHMRAGFIAVSGKLKVFSISCVSAKTASGPVTVNLAICLAQAGFRVTVVAGSDDRTCETLLGAAASPGLAEVLLADVDLNDSVQAIHGITFLSGGREPAKARELYAGPSLKATITRLSSEADFVLVASPATSSAEADSIALACDAVLVGVTQGVTSNVEVAGALDRYLKLRVTTVGAVSLFQDDRDRSHGGLGVVETPNGDRPTRLSGRRDMEPPANPLPQFSTDG